MIFLLIMALLDTFLLLLQLLYIPQVRVRPFNAREKGMNATCIISMDKKSTCTSDSMATYLAHTRIRSPL